MYASQEYQTAVAHFKAGRLSQSESLLRRILAFEPAHAGAWHYLGLIAHRQNQPVQSERLLRRALDLAPSAAIHCSLANLLQDLGRTDEAIRHYRDAIELDPENPDPCNNLGVILHDRGQMSEAIALYRRALELAPDYLGTCSNLGCALKDVGEYEEAVAVFQRALALAPGNPRIHSNLLFCLAHGASRVPEDWSGRLQAYEHCLSRLIPFSRHACDTSDPDRRLRVGFLSADLRAHTLVYYLEPLWADLDPARLEVFAYHAAPQEDAVSERLRARVACWRNVSRLSDEDLANLIHGDAIDILIDLSGHTAGNRLPVLARKPAPVQASWLGFPGSTGLRTVDYYLADGHLAPPGLCDAQFREKIVRLPVTAGFMPPRNAPEIGELPAAARGYFTFGSFHRGAKLNEGVIELWSRILNSVPDARLLLGGISDQAQRDRLGALFERWGVARDRLIFHPHYAFEQYLELHGQIDLILDTFPYSGGTTTLLAAWMGVPTLTLAGDWLPSRQGAAILQGIGLPEFVTSSPEDYAREAVNWTRRLPELGNLRGSLRTRIQSAPGQQPGALARAFERAMRTMWRRYCAGLAPDSFEVPAD